MNDLGIEREIENWHRYIGVDEDGSCFFFHKEPDYVNGKAVPSKFRSGIKKSCEKVGLSLPRFSLKTFKRRTRSGEYKWEIVH
jgi:hypothetical protein